MDNEKEELILQQAKLEITVSAADREIASLKAQLAAKEQQATAMLEGISTITSDLTIDLGKCIRQTDRLLGNAKRDLRGRDVDSLRDTLHDLQAEYRDRDKWDISKILELDRLHSPAYDDGTRHGASDGPDRSSTWLSN